MHISDHHKESTLNADLAVLPLEDANVLIMHYKFITTSLVHAYILSWKEERKKNSFFSSETWCCSPYILLSQIIQSRCNFLSYFLFCSYQVIATFARTNFKKEFVYPKRKIIISHFLNAWVINSIDTLANLYCISSKSILYNKKNSEKL